MIKVNSLVGSKRDMVEQCLNRIIVDGVVAVHALTAEMKYIPMD